MLYIIILKIGSRRRLGSSLRNSGWPLSPAGGGRMVEHFKLSSGGGLGVQHFCPPLIVNTLISKCFPRQRGTMSNPQWVQCRPLLIRLPTSSKISLSTLIRFISPFGPAIKPSSDMCINESIFSHVVILIFVLRVNCCVC